MSEASVMPAPEIQWPTGANSKWESEYGAFQRLRSSLLLTHRGKYVAVHEGQVVESGEDKISVAKVAYARFGYQPIYVGLVSDDPPSVVRMPSPRLFRVANQG